MLSFTICSNNYIYRAKVLANSINELCIVPVYLFLVDSKVDQVDYDNLNFHKVIYLEDLSIPNLQWMKENYSIVEFNTAIKPFAFKYIFTTTLTTHVYYFDPDIKVYQSLYNLEQYWNNCSILLTPHILTPIPLDGFFPDENLFLNHGIYNLGFLGLKRGTVTDQLLQWWAVRLTEKCIIDLREGYFVDQLWFNLVPSLFKSTSIIENRGCNVAYWNLHERNITLDNNGNYWINKTESLFFYHFSSFDFTLQYIGPKLNNNRYSFKNKEDLLPLYKNYYQDMEKHTPDFYEQFEYFAGKYPIKVSNISLLKRLFNKIKFLIKY